MSNSGNMQQLNAGGIVSTANISLPASLKISKNPLGHMFYVCQNLNRVPSMKAFTECKYTLFS